MGRLLWNVLDVNIQSHIYQWNTKLSTLIYKSGFVFCFDNSIRQICWNGKKKSTCLAKTGHLGKRIENFSVQMYVKHFWRIFRHLVLFAENPDYNLMHHIFELDFHEFVIIIYRICCSDTISSDLHSTNNTNWVPSNMFEISLFTGIVVLIQLET